MKKNKMIIALLEEYRDSTIDFKNILQGLSIESFEKIRDEKTENPDCISIKSISYHLVQSGYTYANYINAKIDSEWNEYNQEIKTPEEAVVEINKMLDFSEGILNKIILKSNAEIGLWKYDARWGVTFDFEQLMEHAIVHFLRHRRQVNNFLMEETK